MVQKNRYLFAIGGVIALIFAANSFVLVDQRQQAVVFEFGKVVREISEPGLSFKMPFVQSVIYYEKRLFNIPIEARELTASDSKRVIVDAFAYLRISNPTSFYTSVFSQDNALVRVRSRLESSLRKVIGRYPLVSLLSYERGEIMREISLILDAELSPLGMEVVDVRISRADLPQENTEAICKRMQTARGQEAKKIRAEGNAEAARIIAEADKAKNVLIAEAYAKGELIRGQGEAKAAEIFNKAYAKDFEFFKFYKSMKAYESIFADKDSYFVLSPSSNFMNQLKLGKSSE